MAQPLELVDEFKYLGMIFTRSASMDVASEAWSGNMMASIRDVLATTKNLVCLAMFDYN